MGTVRIPTIYVVSDDDCMENDIHGYLIGPQEPSAYADEFWKLADFNPSDFDHSLRATHAINMRARLEAMSDAAGRLHGLAYEGTTLGDLFVDWLCKERGFERVPVKWSMFPIGC